MNKLYPVLFLSGFDAFNAGERAGLRANSAKQAIMGGHAELVVEETGSTGELVRAELMEELGLSYTMHIGDDQPDEDEDEDEDESPPDLEVGDIETFEEANGKGPSTKNKRSKGGKGKESFKLAE